MASFCKKRFFSHSSHTHTFTCSSTIHYNYSDLLKPPIVNICNLELSVIQKWSIYITVHVFNIQFSKTPVDIARAKGYTEVLTALSSDQVSLN